MALWSARQRNWRVLWLTLAVAWSVAAMARANAEEAHYNAVVSLYNAGQWQAAITKIEEREKLEQPDAMRAKYLYAKGLAYDKGNKPAEARAAYEALIAKLPNAPEAHPARVAVVHMDYAKGDLDAVIAAYPKLDQAKLTPAAKKNLSLMYAECLYGKKDSGGAFTAYKAAIAAGNDAAALAPKLFDLTLRMANHAELVALTAQPIAGVQPEVQALARAESMLALNRFAEADAEAQKVPANSSLAPRAAFARAQALLRQNKFKEAAAPLKVAIAGMKDPAAPAAAHIALVECLFENGEAAEATKALDQAEKAVRTAPEADRTRMNGQIALLRLRASGTDKKKLIAAATDARASVPKDQLPKLLYLRLFTLSEEGDRKGILATLAEDYPILQAGAEDGPATLIYFNALKDANRLDEAWKLLEEFIKRKPATPEASRGRLLLASEALRKNDYAAARPWFDALAADGQAPGALGKSAFDEAMFNRALVLQKLDDHAGCAKALAALVAAKPDPELLKRALPVLGQSYAVQKDYGNAAATWKQALALKVDGETDLRERLARVLVAANDHAGAVEQCTILATLAGGESKLQPATRELWARALFAGGKFLECAGRFEALAVDFPKAAPYAYECAVAYDRAGKNEEASKWYAVAQTHKGQLLGAYAAAVDSRAAMAKLQSKSGDMGGEHWANELVTAKDDKAFESALTALRRVASIKPMDEKIRKRLSEAAATQPADQPRRYMMSAMVVQALADTDQPREADKLTESLAADFALNEKKIDPKSSGGTLAPAMIFFYRGEALRRVNKFTDALVAYETVLSAYPYNEWPDAATCGVAECLVALAQTPAAIAKFKEVLAAPAAPGNEMWRALAARRIAELEKK